MITLALFVIGNRVSLDSLDFMNFRQQEVNGKSSICGIRKPGLLIQFPDLIAL